MHVNSATSDVYACEIYAGSQKIYKQTGGTGSWDDQLAPYVDWTAITVNSSNGDVWAASTSKIYKQTGGTGSWVDQSSPVKTWSGISVNPSNGDVYACESSTNNIYRITEASASWTVDPNTPTVNQCGAIDVNEANGAVFLGDSNAGGIDKQSSIPTFIKS